MYVNAKEPGYYALQLWFLWTTAQRDILKWDQYTILNKYWGGRLRAQQVANDTLQISYLHANPVVIISLIQYRSLRGKNRNKLCFASLGISVKSKPQIQVSMLLNCKVFLSFPKNIHSQVSTLQSLFCCLSSAAKLQGKSKAQFKPDVITNAGDTRIFVKLSTMGLEEKSEFDKCCWETNYLSSKWEAGVRILSHDAYRLESSY